MSEQPEARVPATLPALLRHSAAKYPDVRAVFAPHQKPILELTYEQLSDEVAACGAGLLKAGVSGGEHVALLSDNRPAWLIADLAITGIGAVDVPRGSDTSTGEFEFILQHSGCIGAFVQDARLYKRLAGTAALANLRFVVLMDDSEIQPAEDGPAAYKLSDLVEMGRSDVHEFSEAASAVTPDTVATIVYTSGTTGSPKGVVLTHNNLMTQPLKVDLDVDPQPGEIQLSILPAWHAYERATEYYGLYHGTTITYSDKRYIKDDLLKLCPHLLPCVPRIWESVYKGIQSKVASAPEKEQKAFKLFIGIGQRYIEARRTALGLKVMARPESAATKFAAYAQMAALAPMYALGDRLVFSKIRKVTGARLKAAVSGGGSLAPYLDDFFEIVGIPILNGYGLTETSPVLTVRTLHHNVRGSVGRPIAGTELKIMGEDGREQPQGERGEVWARGPQLMQGYYKNTEATAKVVRDDGWFVTGDLGWVTATGDLVISGRAKDTIVLSSGENVEPEPIEDACRKSSLVQQIVLVGNDQKTLGALVVPEFGALADVLGMSAETEPEEIVRNPEASKIVRQSLNETMAADGRFKASESISKVHLLSEPFSDTNGMLTNTMKIKKNVVCEKYAEEIKAMY